MCDMTLGGQSTFQSAMIDTPLPTQGGTLIQDASGDFTWTASVSIKNAHRLRLQLAHSG